MSILKQIHKGERKILKYKRGPTDTFRSNGGARKYPSCNYHDN